MSPAHHRPHRLLFALAVAWMTGTYSAGQEADELASAATAPLPTLEPQRLHEENLGYKARISMQGEMTVDATLTITKEPLESDAGAQAIWRVAYSEEGPVPPQQHVRPSGEGSRPARAAYHHASGASAGIRDALQSRIRDHKDLRPAR